MTFGHQKVSFVDQQSVFGSPKSVESRLWSKFATWEAPKDGFLTDPHLFLVVLVLILVAQSRPKSDKFEVRNSLIF